MRKNWKKLFTTLLEEMVGTEVCPGGVNFNCPQEECKYYGKSMAEFGITRDCWLN